MVKEEGHRLVPAKVLSAVLGVSTKDIELEAAAGRLPHIRVGERGVLFDLDHVVETLLRRAAGPLVHRGRARAGRDSKPPRGGIA